jgi:hypothetical protein
MSESDHLPNTDDLAYLKSEQLPPHLATAVRSGEVVTLLANTPPSTAKTDRTRSIEDVFGANFIAD